MKMVHSEAKDTQLELDKNKIGCSVIVPNGQSHCSPPAPSPCAPPPVPPTTPSTTTTTSPPKTASPKTTTTAAAASPAATSPPKTASPMRTTTAASTPMVHSPPKLISPKTLKAATPTAPSPPKVISPKTTTAAPSASPPPKMTSPRPTTLDLTSGARSTRKQKVTLKVNLPPMVVEGKKRRKRRKKNREDSSHCDPTSSDGSSLRGSSHDCEDAYDATSDPSHPLDPYEKDLTDGLAFNVLVGIAIMVVVLAIGTAMLYAVQKILISSSQHNAARIHHLSYSAAAALDSPFLTKLMDNHNVVHPKDLSAYLAKYELGMKMRRKKRKRASTTTTTTTTRRPITLSDSMVLAALAV